MLRTAIVAAVMAVMATVLSGCGGSGSDHSAPAAIVLGGSSSTHGGLHGDQLRPPHHMPRIALTDTSGHRYRLGERTAGKLTLIYFGYTHCPDICPTTMADLAQALHQVPASVRRQVLVIFISVDPKRDSASVLRAWLNHFDRHFIGLRAPIKRVIAVQDLIGVPATKLTPGHGLGYSVQHSAQVLAYDRDGIAHYTYTAGTSPHTYAQDLPHLGAERH